MHYLDTLAERLVLAYEDEENLREWVGFADRLSRRRQLIRTLRETLEREVACGRLGYHARATFGDVYESEQPQLLQEDWT